MTTRDLWQYGGLDADARLSFARLLVALDDLENRGLMPPCQNPARAHWWTSEDHAEREAAAHGCARCPLLDTCAQHARHEHAHVWAGRDRTPGRNPQP